MHARSFFRKAIRPGAVLAVALGAALVVFGGAATANHAQASNGNGNGGAKVQIYRANLSPLNAGVDGQGAVSGFAMIMVRGDTITVQVHASGLAAGPHAMHIHTGTSCPTSAADVNNDGFIDVVEGIPAYGPILVPLDSDLSTQAAGMFPSPNNGGILHYRASTSLSAMLADLHAPDPNPNDAVVKLAPGEDLNLAMRHIVIHGVAASTALPSTVASLPGAPATATLPVACGAITQVK